MKKNDILNILDELIPDPVCSLDYNKDYELLIAVMLSAQSTDERVNMVTKQLFKYTLEDIDKMDIEKIESIIRPVGTYTRKAKYIKDIAHKLLTECNGHVPRDRAYIESLPGIGHKSCNVVLNEIYKEPAIAVDTHVSRVSKRLGFSNETDDVLKIERTLMEKFPREKWGRLHLQLLLFGRHICKSKKPDCTNCPFRDKLCKQKDLK